MRGLTLVEGLVAVFILTTVFFAAIGLYPSFALATLDATDRSTASGLASMTLEDVRMQDFDAIPVGDTALPDQDVDGQVFHAVMHVDVTAVDVKRVQVTILWETRHAGSVRYETAVFDSRGGQL